MAARKPITMDTSHGEGTARAEPVSDPTTPDAWELSHPWGGLRFYGTMAEARAELSKLVNENEARE